MAVPILHCIQTWINRPVYMYRSIFNKEGVITSQIAELLLLKILLMCYLNVCYTHKLSKRFVGDVIGMDRENIAQCIPVGYNTAFAKYIFRMILQSLGRYYEHQRPDRDQFVSIQWENIATGIHVGTGFKVFCTITIFFLYKIIYSVTPTCIYWQVTMTKCSRCLHLSILPACLCVSLCV